MAVNENTLPLIYATSAEIGKTIGDNLQKVTVAEG
jgi:hypothetical protein